jgi:hypothetical protein
MLGWWIYFLRNVGIDPNTENLTQGLENLIGYSSIRIKNHADAAKIYLGISTALNSLSTSGTPGTNKANQLEHFIFLQYITTMNKLANLYSYTAVQYSCEH